MTPDKIAAGYNQIADRWVSDAFPLENGIAQHERALSFIDKKGYALEIGCGGNGRFIGLLLRHGFRVEGVDISEKMLSLVRERHSEVTFYHADICSWNMPRKYEFISAWDSIWHIPLSSQKQVLEKIIPEIEDEFMRKAMRLAVDGIDPHVIKETLSTEISFIEERHARCAFIFENIATNGPAFAMIGTLIGMVAMLQHLEDPKAVGPSMAVALLATLYGAMVGYTIGFPIVNRLKERHSEEILNKELVIEGIMAIQEGDNPRIVQQRLMAFLPSSVQVANERE